MAAYLRSSHRSRVTGTPMEVYDTSHPDNVFDPDGGRWVTYCVEHGTICNHETLALARWHAPSGDWCEECRDEVER